MYSQLGIFSYTNYVGHVNPLNWAPIYTVLPSRLHDSSPEELKMPKTAKPLSGGDGW